MPDDVKIQGLEFQIKSNSDSAANELNGLKVALDRLKTVTRGGIKGLTSVSNQLSTLSRALGGINSSSIQKLKSLSDGLTTLKNVGTVKISSSIANQLNNLSDALNQVKWTDGDKISAFAEGLQPLTQLGRANLTTFINQLGKLPNVIEQLEQADLDKFTQQMKELAAAMAPLADEMQKVSAGFSAFPSKVQKVTSGTTTYNSAMRSASKSTSGFSTILGGVKFSALYYGLRMAAGWIGTAITKSNEYQENLNLFTVAMGEYANEAFEYGQTVSDTLGINLSEWIRNQGVFNTLLTGFGDTAERSALMSKNLTQLGYDLSSFFNLPVEEAMQKLQSGISGELEPLRRLGYDLSQARLEAVALSLGIDKSVASMNQAEKAELRYYAIMTQVTTAQGDLARTLESPANQLRILKSELNQLTRAIGNIFIPMLTKILPYAIAVVEVLREIADAIAAYFNFELTDVDYSGMGNLASGAEDTSEAMESAADSAKKLKQYTAGFDELNVFAPDNSNASDTDSALNGSGFGFELPEYDMLGDAIRNKVDEIKKGMQPFVDWLTENIGAVLKTVEAIGAAFLLWKVSKSVMNVMSFFQGLVKGGVLKSIGSGFKVLGGVIIGAKGAVDLFTGAFDSWKNGLGIDKVNEMLFGSIEMVGGLGLAFGPVGGAIGAVISGVTMFVSGVKDAKENGLDWLNGTLIPIGSTLGGAGIGAAIGMLGGPIGAAAGAAIGLVVGGVTDLALYLSEDAVQAVEIFDDSISDATREKVEPFIEKVRTLDDTLAKVEYTGQIITDETVENVKQQTSAIVETITNELDADKNSALGSLDPLKEVLSSDGEYAGIAASIDQFYADAEQKTKDGEAKINEIMSQAAQEGRALKTEEWFKIQNIQDDMLDTGVMHLSESEVEYQTIMNRMKDNSTRVSLEQASSIIKDAQSTRDSTIQAAEEQYAGIQLKAQHMLDVGAINQGQYDEIMSAAAETRKSTIDDANRQYNEIYNATTTKLDGTSKYIDKETGEIKSNWTVMCESISSWASKTWDKIYNNAKQFGEDVKKWWSGFWRGLVNVGIDGVNWLIEKIENGVNYVVDAVNWVIEKLHLDDNIGTLGRISIDRIERLEIPQYAQGGFVDEGQLFVAREAGAEMVGSIGRRTAVANNDQIVEGISTGVSVANDGVIAAIYALMNVVEEKDMNVSITEDAIGRSYDRYNNRRGIRVNKGAFSNAY